MTLTEMSNNVLKDYISSVLYIDDKIFKYRGREVDNEELPLKIIVPGREDVRVETERVEPSNLKESVSKFTSIDVNELTQVFAEEGVLCSLYQPDGNVPTSIVRKADVLVLDWQINNDNGGQAKDIILSMKDALLQGLHLFVIWTNDFSNRSSILNEIESALGSHDAIVNKGDCIEIGQSKIFLIGKATKEENSDLGQSSSDLAVQKASVKSLPQVIFNLLSNMTEGLVSNTMIKAISILKENSAKLLSTFNKKLDCAYLAHRAMCPNPEDGEHLLLKMIGDSFTPLLSSSSVVKYCGMDSVELWLDENIGADFSKQVDSGGKNVNLSLSDLKLWMKNGYVSLLMEKAQKLTFTSKSSMTEEERRRQWIKDAGRNSMKKWAMTVFPHTEGDNGHAEFARLSSSCSVIEDNYVPFLTLGSVIQLENEAAGKPQFVCIQQRCDSVRLGSEVRNFLFLPIKNEAASGDLPIMISDTKKYVSMKSYDITVIPFVKTEGCDIVRAWRNGNGKFMYTDNSNQQYRWLYDLKDSHAQRISDKYTSVLSRVGLDESEWLRREK